MTEDAHRDIKKVLASRRYAWQAQLAEDLMQSDLTNKAWKLAISKNPQGYVSWHDYLTWLSKNPKYIDWKKLEAILVKNMGKHPYPMFELIGIIEKQAFTNTKERFQTIARLHREVSSNWKVNRYLEHTVRDQLARHQNPEDQMVFAEAMLPEMLNTPKGSYIMEWAQKLFLDSSSGRQRKMAMMKNALEIQVAKGNNDGLKSLFNSLILQAVENGDHKSFHSLAAQARKAYKFKSIKLPKFTPFSDANISKGGLLHSVGKHTGADQPAS